MKITAVLLAPLLFLVSARAGAHSVHYVDAVNGPFFTIQEAIDAARDGDVVLVYPGSYEGFELTKGISIRSATEPCRIQGSIRITDVGPTSSASIARLQFVLSYLGAISLANCQGDIRIQDVEVEYSYGVVRGAIGVVDCGNVLLERIDFPTRVGGWAGATIQTRDSRVRINKSIIHGLMGYIESPGGAALHATRSRLEITESTLTGGEGGPGHLDRPGDGGNAVELIESQAVFVGDLSHGAFEGPPGRWAWGRGRAPGIGLVLEQSSAQAAGVTIDSTQGQGLLHVDATPRLDLDEQITLGQDFQVTVQTSEPGLVLMLLSSHLDFTPTALQGPALGPPWSAIRWLGTAGADGQTQATFSVQDDPQLDGLPIVAQAALFSPAQDALSNVAGRVVSGEDCNLNRILDQYDIESGNSQDCDGNGVPDECQPDCDSDGLPDVCEIAAGAADCNGNGVPDVCEIAEGAVDDCNLNGIPDQCDLAAGTSLDLDGDGRLDECRRTLRIPSTYPTIGAAIEDSRQGDILVIADGTYSGPENTDFWPTDLRHNLHGKALTFRSENGPENCVIEGGRFLRTYMAPSLTVVDGFTFREGFAGSNGGASILVEDCRIEIRNCHFVAGLSRYDGGAISLDGSVSASVSRCVFLGNQARSGGAIETFARSRGPIELEIRDCLFLGNSGPTLHLRDTNASVHSCTFFDNFRADGTPQDISVSGGALEMSNCILWHSGNQDFRFYRSNTATHLAYCNVKGGIPLQFGRGPGNVDLDPRFVAPAQGDLHLSLNSPCIDAGDPATVIRPGETDLDGEPRIQGWRIDIGHDEVR